MVLTSETVPRHVNRQSSEVLLLFCISVLFVWTMGSKWTWPPWLDQHGLHCHARKSWTEATTKKEKFDFWFKSLFCLIWQISWKQIRCDELEAGRSKRNGSPKRDMFSVNKVWRGKCCANNFLIFCAARELVNTWPENFSTIYWKEKRWCLLESIDKSSELWFTAPVVLIPAGWFHCTCAVI